MSRKYVLSSLLLLIAACISSCGNPNDAYLKRVMDLGIDRYRIDNVLLIPNEGCGGCISTATSYAVRNEEKLMAKGTIVVFTGVQDYKLFKNQVGEDFLTSKLVVIDSTNRFMQEPVVSIYPQLFRLSSGKITEVLEFDPTFNPLGIEAVME